MIMNKLILPFFCFAFLLVGCSTTKPEGKTEAEVLYKEAEALMKDGRYIMATEKLNQLKNKFPYSFYATPAELMQADILFKQENYIESAAAFMIFRDFHPRHEKMDYVVFKIAESYFKQMPTTIDRDLEGGVEAIRFYEELQEKYPNSPYTEEAKTNILKAQGMLKSKEKYVADFYYKTKSYEAARWRYLDLISLFPTDEDLVSYSMRRIVSSSLYAKDYEKCITFATEFLGNLKNKDKNEVNKLKTTCQNKLN